MSIFRYLILTLWVACAFAQPLYIAPEGVETRWASPENPTGAKGAAAKLNAGRKGRAAIPIKAGESLTLAEVHGSSGTVRRIWVTISDRSPAMIRGLKLDMYWDGAATPAVRAPLGDFFMHTLGRMVPFQSALFASPEGRSFNCYIPMPFRSGMKIVVTNESGKDLRLALLRRGLHAGRQAPIQTCFTSTPTGAARTPRACSRISRSCPRWAEWAATWA